jgi:hypothetical protein
VQIVKSKHYLWQKAWSREASGHLAHTSGLRVLVRPGDGFTDLETDAASLAIFQARETSRGVPVFQHADRLKRLMREAEEWQQKNP